MKPQINFDAFELLIIYLFGGYNLDRLCDGKPSDDNAPVAQMACQMLDLMGVDHKKVGPWVISSEWTEPGDMAKYTWVHNDRIRTPEEYLHEAKQLLPEN